MILSKGNEIKTGQILHHPLHTGQEKIANFHKYSLHTYEVSCIDRNKLAMLAVLDAHRRLKKIDDLISVSLSERIE